MVDSLLASAAGSGSEALEMKFDPTSLQRGDSIGHGGQHRSRYIEIHSFILYSYCHTVHRIVGLTRMRMMSVLSVLDSWQRVEW